MSLLVRALARGTLDRMAVEGGRGGALGEGLG